MKWVEALLLILKPLLDYLERYRREQRDGIRQNRDEEVYGDPGSSFDNHFGVRTTNLPDDAGETNKTTSTNN